MLDIKRISENAELFDRTMQNRGNTDITSAQLIELDNQRRHITSQIQELQNKRNSLAKEIALIKKDKGDAEEKMKESKIINQQLKELEEQFYQDDKLHNILLGIPNLLEESVPVGADENDNLEIEKYGSIPEFDFIPKEHFIIGEQLKLLDLEKSAVMSGSRFSILYGNLSKLERALSNFMLDIANEFGYIEVSPPNLVKDNAMIGSGQLPKFAEEAFKTSNDYWLIPTSEVSLVNLLAGTTIKEEELPIRFTAYTPCFRSEAGSAGKDTRGIIRQHQFKKVELVSFTTQEQSQAEHEAMTNVACEVLKRLKLPYRKMLLCSGDTGFCSQKTYDLEVWLPGQNKYREISSCSNCGDFQARRLQAKYKSSNNKKPLYLHTLNGSSLAIGRTIVAILENYQNKDGSVNIPESLISYMGGIDIIR